MDPETAEALNAAFDAFEADAEAKVGAGGMWFLLLDPGQMLSPLIMTAASPRPASPSGCSLLTASLSEGDVGWWVAVLYSLIILLEKVDRWRRCLLFSGTCVPLPCSK